MTLSRSEAAKLGKISHIGIVVRDMDQAIDYYTSVFGMGPFDVSIFEFKEFEYKGKKAPARVKAGLAHFGDVFIELVQVLEGETPHTDFLKRHGEGIQHIAFRVKGMESILADLAGKGIHPLLNYKLPVGQPEAKEAGQQLQLHEVYLDSERIGGAMIQLMEFKKVPVT